MRPHCTIARQRAVLRLAVIKTPALVVVLVYAIVKEQEVIHAQQIISSQIGTGMLLLRTSLNNILGTLSFCQDHIDHTSLIYISLLVSWEHGNKCFEFLFCLNQ